MMRHKAGLDAPGAADTRRFKDLLDRRRDVLRAALRDQHDAGHRAASEGSATEVHDLKDEAFAGQLANLSGMAREQMQSELGAVQAAMRRIDEGSYGRCVDCDREIGRERLLAQPSAPRCLDCQQRAEGSRAAR